MKAIGTAFTAITAATIVVLTALLAPGPAAAHGDTTIPLFVAADGADRGDCSDAQSPCRTIAYALGLAGKGTRIRVAGGRYAVEGTEELFLILSGVVDVTGGYAREDAFTAPSADSVTILSGVPEEYRQPLRERGFHVIADTKGEDGDAQAVAKATAALLNLKSELQQGLAAAPCVNGSVNGLACNGVDLLAHLPLGAVSARPAAGNDVWGFVDLNSGREYALAGFSLGTAVIDVTEPTAPREVGFIDGQDTVWRDIKVYQNFDAVAGRFHAYAYVTTDGSTDGLFVIDLGGLPHRIDRLAYPSQFGNAHNIYSTSTDFSTGLPLTATPHLIIAGSNLGAGQYRAYSLDDPSAPRFVIGSAVANSLAAGDSSYMHDAASLLINDGRAASCVNATTQCEVLLDFNEEKLEIWDISDIASPQHLNAGRPEYPQRGYVHSGWWSEDRQFAFVHDEFDEQGFGLNTTLRVFSLADLRDPRLVGQWTGPTNAIDHNGYVRGNRYYMSNYSRGLTVLDVSDPGNPQTVGRFDSYPFSDGRGFVGAWGAYPFFPSGTIALSDISEGLFLLDDATGDVPAGSLGFGKPSFAVSEGELVELEIARLGGTEGSVSVDVEVVPATAGGADFTLDATTLTWADGDAAVRSVGLAAVADGLDENLEMLIVRLVAPAGGATVARGRGAAQVYLGDPGGAAELRLFEDTVSVTERGYGKAVLVLQRRGNAAGAVSVDYSLSGGTASPTGDFSGAAAGTIRWPDGDARPKWLEFDLSDDGIAEPDEFFELTFGNAVGAVIAGPAIATVNILDGSGPNTAPNALLAAGQSVAASARVTLDGSGSNDPDGDPLSHEWTQLAGPPVTLSAPTAAVTAFTAPAVSSDTLLQFRLTVSDPAGLSDSATAAVTVGNAGSGQSAGGAAGTLLLLAGAALFARRRRAIAIRRDAA